MSTNAIRAEHPVSSILGDARWIRAHVSTLAVGAVLLVCINLIINSDRLWSLTAIGIWGMLLVVHVVILAIARLSTMLLDDDDDEVVLLPVKDAVIVDPTPEAAATWTETKPDEPAAPKPPTSDDTVSWSIATDAAQVRRNLSRDDQQ